MTFEAWLQSRLTAHGFACGPIDGVVGPVTIAAIRAFEASRRLPVDGRAGEAVVSALRQSSSRVDPETAAAVENRVVPEAEIRRIALVGDTWPRQAGVPAFYGRRRHEAGEGGGAVRDGAGLVQGDAHQVDHPA